MSPELLVLFFTFAGLLYFFRILKRNKLLENITGPAGIPLFGNALEISRRGNDYMVDMLTEWNSKYGQRYKIFLGLQPYIAIWNAQDVEKVLSSQMHIEKSKDYDFIMPWLGTGLLTSAGQKWHTRRKMLTPAFHFKILEDFLVIMNEQSQVLVEVLQNLENKGTFNIFPCVTHCALDIICETAMGRKINAQLQSDSEYVTAIYRISELIQYRQIRPWLSPNFIWRLSPSGREESRTLNILHSFTSQVIEERKAGRKNSNKTKLRKSSKNKEDNALGVKRRLAFLDLLLDAQEKDSAALPDNDIREETDTFMFEGHDTTAANVNWTIFLLGHNLDTQAKIHEELDEIFNGDKSRPITLDDLSRMKYLELCIKESLRLYPSVPFIARAIHTDCQLDEDTIIPPGTIAMILTYHTHRDPKVFPNPEKFIPERFLPENSAGRHPFAYVPFSAGPRNCIGQKFAIMEEKVMLANVFRNFNVKSMESREDITLLAELIMRPKYGLQIQIKPKN